ncbi:hypothetical protein ACHAPZ_003304 [Fusarium culmorum]
MDSMFQVACTFKQEKKLQQREKEKQKKTFIAEEHDCALRGVTPEAMPEHLRSLTSAETLHVHEAILSAGLTNLAMKFNEQTGYGTLPHMSRETEKALLADLVSIHPIIDHEANFHNVVSQLTPVSSYISDMILRPKGDNATIRIEECHYDEKDPDGKLAMSQGILHAQSLSNVSKDPDPQADVMIKVWAHRACVISAFDPRTIKVLDNQPPTFFGSMPNLLRRFAALERELSSQNLKGTV